MTNRDKKVQRISMLIYSIQSCLTYIKKQLKIILMRLPKKLNLSKRNILLSDLYDKYYSFKNNTEELSQRIAINNVAKVEATLLTIEIRLSENDGCSAFSPNINVLKIKTIGEWFDLILTMVKKSIEQTKTDLCLLTQNFSDLSLHNESRIIEILTSVSYHCYKSVGEVSLASQNAYIIL